VSRQAVCALLALMALAGAAHAQDTALRVVLVEFDGPTSAQLAEGYGAPAERLWCVTSWQQLAREGATVMHITGVREEVAPTTRRTVDLSAASCRGDGGRALPTIHSHPGGSCQFGPGDTEAIVARMAPFDGILCGPRSHAWAFASTLLDAIAWRQQRAMALAQGTR
jgi:hypothetical protein